VAVSVDVETGGPVPGLYPLLAIGACPVDDPDRKFYVELKPAPMHVDERAVEVSWPEAPAGETLRRLRDEGVEPSEAMGLFGSWVREEAQHGKPLYVGFNACFDWSFTHYAFAAAERADPFGYVALDIKSYWAGRAGVPYSGTGKGNLPAWLTAGLGAHTHRADDDAVRQARIYRRMRAYPCSPMQAWRAMSALATSDEHRALQAFLDNEVAHGRAEYVLEGGGPAQSLAGALLIRRRDTGELWRLIEAGPGSLATFGSIEA